MSAADVPLGPLPPRCAAHREEAAEGTCVRCGSFFCAACARRVLDQDYCAPCAARLDTQHLERLRLKLWGRRDGWAWSVGLVSLVLAVVAVRGLWEGAPVVIMLALGACAGAGVAFFLGVRWAREALVGTPLICALVCGLSQSQGTAVLLLLMALTAAPLYFDTRNRLFFRLEVSAASLQRLWHLRENNPLARHALSLGLSALVLPVLAPVALVLGVLALRRVDRDANPPIGRAGQAIAALVLGLAAPLLWSLLLWPSFYERLAALWPA